MFTWDIGKATINYVKHGVSFEEASSIFDDSGALEVNDEKHSEVESRKIRIGTSGKGRALTVVFTVRRLENGKEKIRIISARQASRKERQALARL